MASPSTWERIERQKLRRQEWPTRPGSRPDPSRPAGTDMVPQIKHIIVLMMENHSGQQRPVRVPPLRAVPAPPDPAPCGLPRSSAL